MIKKDLSAELEAMGIGEVVQLPVVREIAKPPHAHWERCKAWIEAGLEGSLLTIADVERGLSEGTAMLWPGNNCALVSEFVNYPSGERASQVLSAGGDLEELLSMVPGMEAFARLNGCSQSTIEGRKGWEKVMKPSGYEFLSLKLVKRL